MKETIQKLLDAERKRYVQLASQIDAARAQVNRFEQEYVGTAGKIEAYTNLLKELDAHPAPTQ